jgi:phosphate transport system substrate-binding protein
MLKSVKFWSRLCLVVLPIMSAGPVLGSMDSTALRGNLIVVGRGPERSVIEQLARALERTHVGTTVEIRWNRNFRIHEMVASGDADIAVDGQERADLAATTVAWDGLAVIVNFSNPIKEVTKQQVASLFSGRIRDWSQVDERGSGRVQVMVRSDDQNLSDGFGRSLGIVDTIAKDGETIRSDQKVLSRVSGQLGAVSYMSLQAALDAVTYGLSVRLLIVDGVEPGTPTVESGRYPLKRPVILLSRKDSTPLAKSFRDFALSPTGQSILSGLYSPVSPDSKPPRF